MRIEYLPSAQNDLLEIGDHYRKVGGNQLARRMIRQIRGDIKALLNYTAPPYALVPDIHRLVAAKGAFLVFHRINTTESIIEVVHVRRSEREPATQKDLKQSFSNSQL